MKKNIITSSLLIIIFVLVIGGITVYTTKKNNAAVDAKIDQDINSVIKYLNSFEYERAINTCNELLRVYPERVKIDDRDELINAFIDYASYYEALSEITLDEIIDKSYEDKVKKLRKKAYKSADVYPGLEDNLMLVDDITDIDNTVKLVNDMYDDMLVVIKDSSEYRKAITDKIYSIENDGEWYSFGELETFYSEIEEWNNRSKKNCDNADERVKEVEALIGNFGSNNFGPSGLAYYAHDISSEKDLFDLSDYNYPVDFEIASDYYDLYYKGKAKGEYQAWQSALSKYIGDKKTSITDQYGDYDYDSEYQKVNKGEDTKASLIFEEFVRRRRNYNVIGGDNNIDSIREQSEESLVKWVLYNKIISYNYDTTDLEPYTDDE